MAENDDNADDKGGSERKERVIHTRVSETMDQEIRQRAEGLGVSVSNLIRNVLGHAFGLVEDVITDSANVARSARGEGVAPKARPAGPARVLGWQPLVLSINAVCVHCNAILTRGSQAAVSVTDGSGPREIICPTCLEEVEHDGSDDNAH